jgi:CRISPR type III-B/RAMP module RAMP protein Cmr6
MSRSNIEKKVIDSAAPGMKFGPLWWWFESSVRQSGSNSSGNQRGKQGGGEGKKTCEASVGKVLEEIVNKSNKPNPAKAASVVTIKERQTKTEQELAKLGWITCRAKMKLLTPMVVGVGWNHPSENGFLFQWPHGISVIPGSSIKGVLRRCAEDLYADDRELVNSLFGEQVSETEGRVGQLRFWDGFPYSQDGNGSVQDAKLQVEIITPHFSEWLKGDPHKVGPVETEDPIPIPFLALKPGNYVDVRISYRLGLRRRQDGEELRKCVEELLNDLTRWRGFGARTSGGFGSVEAVVIEWTPSEDCTDEPRGQDRREEEDQSRRETSSVNPVVKQVETFLLEHGVDQGLTSEIVSDIVHVYGTPQSICEGLMHIVRIIREKERLKNGIRQHSKEALESLFAAIWQELIKCNHVVEPRIVNADIKSKKIKRKRIDRSKLFFSVLEELGLSNVLE